VNKIENRHEIVPFLQRYIQINTAQPHPHYEGVCDLFEQQAANDGFNFQKIILPSGHPVIIITLYGSNKQMPSLILNHHMDVVPATNSSEWISDPFAAEIHNGCIIGRGAQDTKSTGVAHYFALKTLKRAEIVLQRTVHLLMVPDEEIGGSTGTKQFIQTEAFKQLNAGYIIDEGVPSGCPRIIALKISERKPLQITITVQGALAHGSKLNSFNAVHELVSLLIIITQEHEKQQKASATQTDGLLMSLNITSLQAGVFKDGHVSFNIVPDRASATLDIRVPPSRSTKSVQEYIDSLIASYPHSSYAVHAAVFEDSAEPSTSSLLYTALAETVQELNLKPKPLFFEGATDIRFYHQKGVEGVGCTPFTDKENLHGTNESLSIESLMQGTTLMTHFIKKFCT
jgi:aminoacylase